MANQVGGGFRPTSVVPQQIQQQEKPSLQDAEKAKVQQQQTQKAATQDAARAAQQAGFQRLGPKAGRSFDVGDSSRSPIPLPDEQRGEEGWNQERLDSAQQNLTMAGAQFGEMAKAAEGGKDMGLSLLQTNFSPTEGSNEKLQLLLDKPPPEPIELEDVDQNLKSFFNLDLGDDVPLGQRMLATGLVVAGQADDLEITKGTINERKMAGGLQKVAERSNQAVGEAQKMNKGVSRELSLQRTFVFKR